MTGCCVNFFFAHLCQRSIRSISLVPQEHGLGWGRPLFSSPMPEQLSDQSRVASAAGEQNTPTIWGFILQSYKSHGLWISFYPPVVSQTNSLRTGIDSIDGPLMPLTSIYLVPRSMVYIDFYRNRWFFQMFFANCLMINHPGQSEWRPPGDHHLRLAPLEPLDFEGVEPEKTLTGEVRVTCLRLYMFVPLIESIMNSHELLYISSIILNDHQFSQELFRNFTYINSCHAFGNSKLVFTARIPSARPSRSKEGS